MRPDAYVAIAEKLSRKIFSSMSQLFSALSAFLHLWCKGTIFFWIVQGFFHIFSKKVWGSSLFHFFTLYINILEEPEAEKLYYIYYILIYNIYNIKLLLNNFLFSPYTIQLRNWKTLMSKVKKWKSEKVRFFNYYL